MPKIRTLSIFAFYGLIYLVFFFIHIPISLKHEFFALRDSGSNFTLQYLMSQGLVPTVDFGYQYGLLALLVGKAWFSIFSETPWSYIALVVICGLGIAFSMARFSFSVRMPLAGILFIGAAIGHFIYTSPPNLCHVLEASLLSAALTEHSRGRRSNALALTTLALFNKPTMAYFYGLILVVIIVRKSVSKKTVFFKSLALKLLPAAIVGLLAVIILSYFFGVSSLLNSVFPIDGAKHYQIYNYGFFKGVGRYFWLPPNAKITYYLGTTAGFWLVGSLFLLVFFIRSSLSSVLINRLQRQNEQNTELILTCTALHFLFIFFFFGNTFSWSLYCYVLVMGVSALSTTTHRWSYAVLALAVLTATGNKSSLAAAVCAWKTDEPSRDFHGLWLAPGEKSEWLAIQTKANNKKTVFLSEAGAAEVFFPALQKPVTYQLYYKIALQKDINRKLEQISQAEYVVTPTNIQLLQYWPELRKALASFKPIVSGKFITLSERIP